MRVPARWERGLVGALACAGLAWPLRAAPPAQAPVAAEQGERTMIVQDMGRPGQKCRVLRSWRTKDGIQCYEVQSLETDEFMTVVESGPPTTLPGSKPGTRVQMRATKIYHWGRSNAPPPGTPAPPGYVNEAPAAVTQTAPAVPLMMAPGRPTTAPQPPRQPVAQAPVRQVPAA